MPDSAPPVLVLRIVSLNLWGGLALDRLLDFVREQAPRADLFCFQEAIAAPESLDLACGFRTTLYHDIAEVLGAFDGAFDPVVSWTEPTEDGRQITVPFGLATFAPDLADLGASRRPDHRPPGHP